MPNDRQHINIYHFKNKRTNAYMLLTAIGIDKLELYGFTLVNHNLKYLLSLEFSGIVEAKYIVGNTCNVFTQDYDDCQISRITIHDNVKFLDLVIGWTADKNGYIHPYAHLTLSVSLLRGSNLSPMSYDDYSDALDVVLDYINSRYQIELKKDQARVEYMELNVNMILDAPPAEYNRVLTLIYNEFLSKTLKKDDDHGKLIAQKNAQKKIMQTYKRSNDSLAVVCYDKTAQLHDKGFDAPENCLRFELILKNRQKVVSSLHTNEFCKINQVILDDYFYDFFQKNIIKKSVKWKTQRAKDIKRLLLMSRTKSTRNWHHILLQEIRNLSEQNGTPYILDINQIIDVLRKEHDANYNHSRRIKALTNITINNDIYRQGDLDKLDEIVNNLMECNKVTDTIKPPNP